MIPTRSFPLVLVAGLCLAATAHAQSLSAPDSARVAPATAAADSTRAGPRLESTATGIRRMAAADDALLVQRRQPQSVGQPVALMIVGGAAIVLGAVIGGDVGTLFMIGGSATLLIGLYQYLK